jgi:hypothetical protein
MAGTQAIATALIVAIQLMVAAIIAALAATEAPATTAVTDAADQVTTVVFACTPAQNQGRCPQLQTSWQRKDLQSPNWQLLLL